MRLQLLLCLMSLLLVERVNGQSNQLRPFYTDPMETLKLDSSPYASLTDVVVQKGAKLVIEPGCELQFAKGKQLIVHGTLEAKGNLTHRITFTKLPRQDEAAAYANRKRLFSNERFRLVEGDTFQDGKLQIFYNSKWNYVCSTQFK